MSRIEAGKIELEDKPFDQYSTYTEADPAQADRGNLVTVKNVGASRKYIYTPYPAGHRSRMRTGGYGG